MRTILDCGAQLKNSSGKRRPTDSVRTLSADSLKHMLEMTNVGGIRIIPYGETNPVVYGKLDSGKILTSPMSMDGETTFGWATVWVAGEDPSGRTAVTVEPNHHTEGKPVLKIDDRVYLADVNILNGDGTTFHFGGYLGTATEQFHFRLFEGRHSSVVADETTIEFDHLAVIPAEFDGGLLIEGLASPPAVMEDDSAPESSGTYEQSWADPFIVDGTVLGIENFRLVNYMISTDSYWDASSLMRGSIEDHLTWDFVKKTD